VRVFVAGATGVIGRPLVAQLLEAGHQVTGMTRSEERAEGLRAAGAEAALCDAFDRQAVREAVATARPETVVHQLTDLPERFDLRKPDYGETARLRREGTANLLEATRAGGARRFVAQSVAFIYAPGGSRLKSEDDPLISMKGRYGEAMEAMRDAEAQVLAEPEIEGLVLRYGFFYGPGTYYGEDGSETQQVRRRRSPVVAGGTAINSFIHVDDAAAATVAAVERGAPGVYNVVDDEPAEQREWLPAFAESVGAKPPRRIPAWLVRMAAGKDALRLARELRGASNEKAKRELGWRPRWASWRQGFREAPR
jgi:nucleoside-diphosphate-sugar epimerase